MTVDALEIDPAVVKARAARVTWAVWCSGLGFRGFRRGLGV